MNKIARYNNLVAKFKIYSFKENELINPHHIVGFNFEVINPWELWYNDLDAEIMFIGQDFSDSSSLKDNLENDWGKEKRSPTNKAMLSLFKSLGYDLGAVNYANHGRHPLFFTNAILGIKKSESGDMGKPVKERWWIETKDYLSDLIDIVQPQYIIAMGNVAYKALCGLYQINTRNDLIGYPIALPDGKVLFRVQHCSPRSQQTRSLEIQNQDWSRIRDVISDSAMSRVTDGTLATKIATKETWVNYAIDTAKRIKIVL